MLKSDQHTEELVYGGPTRWSWRPLPDEEDGWGCRGLNDAKNQDLRGLG